MTPQSSGLSPGSRTEAGDPNLAPALQASQHIQREHLLTIFEHVPAGIVYLDPAGRILAVNPAFDLPLALLDGQQMAQVLENLIRNAVEAMPESGSIRVAAHQSEGRLELSVADSGSMFRQPSP